MAKKTEEPKQEKQKVTFGEDEKRHKNPLLKAKNVKKLSDKELLDYIILIGEKLKLNDSAGVIK